MAQFRMLLKAGTGNPEPGTGNPEPGTGNPEPGTGNRSLGTSGQQFASFFLISARRVLYFISPICFPPLIRVPKGEGGSLESWNPEIIVVEPGARSLSLLEVRT